MFQVEKTIRFHHCDPAGIVFFPNYLMLCHEVIEDWIDRGLGIGFAHLTKTRGLGTPTVKLTTEYLAPSSFGDQLTFELSVTRVGTSSLTLAIRAHVDGSERMRTEIVLVLVEINPMRPVRIPDDIRASITPFLASPVLPA